MKEPKWIVTAFDHKVTKASIRQVLKSPDFHDDEFDTREPRSYSSDPTRTAT